MPLASKSTKKIKKKPIVIIPNNIKTLPKILPKSIISQKSFKEKVNNIKNDIDINIDDIPEDLLDTWDEFEEDILPKIVSKNYNLWLSIFIPFILPSFLKGISGKVELPFDAKQSIQTNAPSEKQIIDHAREYFKSRGLELVRTLSTTDCERLKGQMLDNWGKGPDAFKASFQEDYANTKARLDVIYRSEYICAQNEGILARARNSNHEFKQWNAALDERTCPVCGDQLHGTIIPIEEEFTAVVEHKNGSEEISVNGPPAHVNCRCVLTTLDEDDYDEIKEDSAYLDNVTDFIKLNYKCEFNGTDNKCGLDPDKNTDSNVIAGYVRNDNKLVNSILSGDYDLSEKDENHGLEKIRLLDNIFKDKLLPEKEITYRGISKSNIKNLPDNWNKIGNAISPGTFLSTSRSRSEAEGFITGGSNDDSILIKLILPRNTNAINVSDFVPKTSAYAYSFDENEVLVDRNTEFKVVDYRIENSRNMGELHIATWEAIPDEQKQNTAYLSDAFETIKLNYNCPDSEKSGSGPGSCGGNTDSKIDINPEIAPADYNSFFENFNKISKDKSEPDRIMRRLNAETVQRRFYRKTEEHFNEIKLENDKKLKENDEKLWDNLRPEVQSAIKSYTTQDYGVINSALQDGITREEVSLLKEATSKPLGVSTILYRGINFKMPKDIFKVGATWIHKPFASCSTGSFIAEEAASGKLTHITPEEKTILQIFTEPETKGFAVGKNSFHAGADAGSEVILDAGTKFQTIHSEKRGGMRILTVRAINDEQKQDSSYLEDVSEFIKLNYKCPKGTVDDSNKCNPEEQEKSNTSDSKSASETFIGFKADHDFSSPQDIEANKQIQASLNKAAEPLKKFKPEDRRILIQWVI